MSSDSFLIIGDVKDKQPNQQQIVEELSKQCKSFSKERIINQLNNCYQTDKEFHLQVPKEMKYIVRKHGLPGIRWDQIYQNLIDDNIDDHTKVLLAQTIKYSVKNKDTSIRYEELFEVLRKNNNVGIKSEIVWALSYQLSDSFNKNPTEVIDENFINEINSIIEGSENKPNNASMTFFNNQIQRQFNGNHRNYQQSTNRKIKTSINYSKKISQKIVTKNQQTIKIKYKSTESEELTNTLNSVNIFKSLNKKIKINSNTENLPTIPDKDGSDTSIFRDTYEEVVHLYNKIKSGQTLKKKDKDKYLPYRFIGPGKKWNKKTVKKAAVIVALVDPIILVPAAAVAAASLGTARIRNIWKRLDGNSIDRIIRPLFVDRMIAVIFLEISKKQILHENAIKVLMDCIGTLDQIEEKVLDGPTEKEVAAKEIALHNQNRNRTENGSFSREGLLAKYKNAPDIVANIVRKIDEECIKDSKEIEKILSYEVNQIRLDAIGAIYNCATKTSAILNKKRLEKIEKCLEDNDIEFHESVIKILQISNDTDYKNLCKKCLENLEQNVNVDISLNYIYQQSEVEERCRKLFDECVISRIINSFRITTFNENMKMIYCTIINNYLSHSDTKGLNEVHLIDYALLIDDPQNSSDFKFEVLKIIVLTAEKNIELPDFVIQTLVENINNVDDKLNNFILVALGIISQRQIISEVDKLSPKLLDDWVIVGEGIDITFEKISEDNSGHQSISSIVAKIFISSLQKGVRITDQSLEYLAKALNSNSDKQTRILSAKSLYLALETHDIKNEILIELREYVKDTILDVSVYSTVVYAHSLAKLSKRQEPIMMSHMEYLSLIYVYDDLRLGEESFGDVVNKNILYVLFNEVKTKKEFKDNIFQIFNHILLFENCNRSETIKLLCNYLTNKYLIPEETIFALENLINEPEFSNQILQVFENIIYNRQMISEKILHIISDNLYLSDNNQLRDKSFQLIDIVNDNQDISDDIFNILELERASLSIGLSLSDSDDAIYYLDAKIKEGQKLTISGFQGMSKAIDNYSVFKEEILSILLNVSNYGQIIPNDLIDKLVRIFDPKQVQHHLIEIFENLVKNNQNISNELLLKLDKALENPAISDKVLSIFILKGQKDDKLSEKIISKILDKFLSLENPLIMQQYLSLICSFIQKKNNFKQEPKNILGKIVHYFSPNLISHVQNVFIHALKMDDQDIVRISINGFKILISLRKVEFKKKSVEVLLNLITKNICDENMKQDINTILEHFTLKESHNCILKLCNLKYESNDQLLDILSKFNKPELLEQNFYQINFIIDNCPELNSKALKILLECSNKQNIPDELVDSIGILLASATSPTIIASCCQLIDEIAKTGRKVTNKTLSLLVTQYEEEGLIDILKSNSKNWLITKEFQDRIDFLSQINRTISMNSRNLSEFLKRIRQELQEGLRLSDQSIKNLLSIKNSTKYKQNQFNIKLESEFIDICALILIQNPDYSSNQLIVDSLEKAILSKTINENILNAYKEIIKRTQCNTNHFSSVFNVFIDILDKNENFVKFHFDIFVCIALASEITDISTLEHLENNIDNDNEIIRSWAFRGLRAAYNRGSKSLIFQDWCYDIIDKLEENLNTKIDLDFDLLETIIALKYIDFNKISDKPQDQWTRELLIFDLIERFEISEGERFHFYKTWIEIEEYEQFQNGKSNILLRLLHRIMLNNTMSFNECYDTIKILDKIDFESAKKILSNSKNPYLDLQKKFLAKLIHQRLLNNKNINENYIDDMTSNIISKFGLDISQKFLNAIRSIDNLREFENMLNFAQENKIKISDIYVINTTMTKLKRSLEIKFLGNQIIKVDRLKLAVHLDNLFDNNWTFEQLNDIFSNLNASDTIEKRVKERNFIYVLEILLQYKISPTPKNQDKILLALKKPAERWIQEINRIAVETNFSEIGEVRNAAELIEELRDTNSDNEDLKNLIRINLLKVIEKIKSLNYISQILNNNQENRQQSTFITQWTIEQIQQWANIIKTSDKNSRDRDEFIVEALAVIKQANYLDTGFHLTDAQILTCLVALNKTNDKGRLLQVRTGEGKSTIISVLAVIYALEGKKVDIITSSPVLAERDAKEKAKFYNMFGLQCSDNNDQSIYLTGPKKCYRKQIVYGEATQFQFDTLRTEYTQLNTLDDRKCEVALVDEVDSMLIDDSSKIARLATTIAGMDQLQIIYHLIWNRIIYIQDKIIEVNDRIYLFYGKIGFEQGKIILEYANEQGNIIKISDLKAYLASTSDISHIGQSILENNIDGFIKKNLEDYIRKLIKENISIPKNFIDFVNTQIPKWIDNAITAFNYQENIHYIVQEGLIKPVDYFSTGIVQSSSNWSDGLHQFLQIKHNLKMISETFTTNFLSNREYFTRYGPNLFGLTGTLGSEKAQKVLIDVYKVDLVIIPNLRRKQYLSLPDIVAKNETDWLKEICHSAINESRKERGTLVICETIEHTILIGEKLKHDYCSSAVKLYTMNNMNQEKNVEIVNPGEIIIATNLAGRGTDIKTDQIEKNGGLHVIVTFLPCNKRVEEQAFGRTARQGKRGTGQRILNAANLIYYKDSDMHQITYLRDKNEEEMLNNFIEYELKVITLKDKLFIAFCSLLNKIRESIREQNDPYKKIKDGVKSVFTNVFPSVFESNILLSIEEQWAMFLRKIDDQKSSIDIGKVYKEYAEFRKKIVNDYNNDCVIKNPYYHITIGNDLVINDSKLNNKYDEAMKHFDRAIEIDPKHSAAAFAGRGWLLLKGKERFFRSNKQDLDYKSEAIRAFTKALEILSEEMAALTSIQTLLQQRYSNINTSLSKQLIQKVNILGNYCNSLENVINVIKKSQRLIQITEIIDFSHMENDRENSGILKKIVTYDGIEKDSEKLCDILLASADHIYQHIDVNENQNEIFTIKDIENEFTINFKKKEDNQIVNTEQLINHFSDLSYHKTIFDSNNHSKIYTLIYEKVISNNDHFRRDFLTSLQDLSDERKYEITFNDLTVRQDSGTIDQAIGTINHAMSEYVEYWPPILHNDYRGISVSITEIHAERLKAFLNPNIEIKEATKEIAIAQLKDKSSFFHRHLLPESWTLDLCPVDLEILSDNNQTEIISGLQARDAIGIIEKQTEDKIHYNLTFLSANKISEVLKKEVLFSSNQTVEFIGLNGENVKEKLRNILCNSITLEISDRKENLLEVLYSLDIKYMELYSYEKEKQNNDNIKEVVNKITAERKIKEIKNDSTTITLTDINKSIAEKIIDICPHANFNINFISVDFECLLKELKDELINIHFDILGKEAATTLIQQIRKDNLDFCLIFKKLTSYQAQRLIKEAPIEQENIEINKVKTLSELFMNETRPHLELSEFSSRGIEYLLEISEKRFIPWRSITAVIAIATVQMAVGGILIATGFGATVGMGLITEGAADLFTAYRAYSTRQFSWSDYGKQKAVSLVISATTMGFSAIKDAGKGVQTLVTSVGEEVLEQAGTKVITDGKAVSQVLVETGKNLKSLAVKQIGVTVGENALREGLNKVADVSSHFVLEQLKPKVSESIQSKVNSKFCQHNLLNIVRKMYAIDSLNKQKQLKEKINKIVAEIINPEHNFWRKQWDSIGGPLCKGILSSVQHVGGPFSMGMRILGTLNGIQEITIIIDKVHDELLKKLLQIDQETLSIDKILHRYCEVRKEDINDIVSLLQKEDIVDADKQFANKIFSEKFNSTDLNGLNMHKHKVMNFLESLRRVEFNDLSEIMKLVSDMITEQIFRITESQLISPWSSYGMGELTKAISERVQHRFIVDEKQNSDSQNRENQEKGEGTYNTIAKQIQYNARDYTIAYSRCENNYYSQQKDKTDHGQIDKETKEYVNNIRKNQPASMSDVMALAAEHDLDLKLVDDPNYQPTEEDKAKGTNIVICTEGESDNQGKSTPGHYLLILGDGTIFDPSGDNNNCGYLVLQKLLKDRGIDKSVEDLRNDRAQNIEDNPHQFSKALKAQQWIETRYPLEVNRLLMVGSGKEPTPEAVARGESGLKKIKGSGIPICSRDGHAEQAIRSRIGSGRVTADDIIETYRKGTLYYDHGSSYYIRYKGNTGTTVVVTEKKNGKIVTVQSDDKKNQKWNPVTYRK